jgi:hypothetical protein
MFCQETFAPWRSTIMTHLPHLSKPQATGLALWSLGMVLARSCALTAVSAFLAEGLKQKDNTVRQRLREWCYEAPAKRGKKRQEVRVETCFAPLLAWVLSWWTGTQLALALDATTLGDRFVVLAISVLYRGCAIPVAWVVLEGGKKHAWRREWLRRLRQLRPAVPRGWTVLVLADRGLYARWLFRRMVRLGWHPFLRINNGGTFRPEGSSLSRPLMSLVPEVGRQWSGRGTAFKGRDRQLECTLLARWDAGHKDPWLILTALPAEVSDACWYGLRAWIEQGFKVTKRAGWQWQRTRMSDPARASRLWLAVAVATLWLLSVGGEADEAVPEGPLEDVTMLCPPKRRSRRETRLRLVSVFRRGWLRLLVALIRHEPLPAGCFVPEAWPRAPEAAEEDVMEAAEDLPNAA